MTAQKITLIVLGILGIGGLAISYISGMPDGLALSNTIAAGLVGYLSREIVNPI